MTPLVELVKEGKKTDPILTGKLNAISMIFENRAKMYRKLRNGDEVVEGLKCDYTDAVPHYLMYTTIGRADLIEFELAAMKRLEAFEQMMDN